MVTAVRSSQGIKPILSIMSLAEIQEAIEKLGLEERAELWTWFQEVEETDELLAAVDEGIQAAEEGRVFSLDLRKSKPIAGKDRSASRRTFQSLLFVGFEANFHVSVLFSRGLF